MNLFNFFAELKQRNVYKVAIAYAIVAWLLMQVASQIFPFFEIPNWASASGGAVAHNWFSGGIDPGVGV